MCVPISLVVHPRTKEVWHSPGLWHHTDICNKIGVDYNQVFKPEIRLTNKSINFVDGPIAFKRRLPEELIADIKLLFHKHGVDEELVAQQIQVEVKGTVAFEAEHKMAVHKWIDNNVPNARKLMEFSCHTFEARHFKDTLAYNEPTHQLRQLMSHDYTAGPGSTIHKAWVAAFMRDMNRTMAWKDAYSEGQREYAYIAR